jgi:aspartyl-tRNA synthetase
LLCIGKVPDEDTSGRIMNFIEGAEAVDLEKLPPITEMKDKLFKKMGKRQFSTFINQKYSEGNATVAGNADFTKPFSKTIERDSAKKQKEALIEQQRNEEFYAQLKKDPNDPCASQFGEKNLLDPQINTREEILSINELNETMSGQNVKIRGRIHNIRAKGRINFIVLRESGDKISTIQCVLLQAETSKGMLNYVKRIPNESVVEIRGEVVVPEKRVESCTQTVEIMTKEVWLLDKADHRLPFQLDAASKRQTEETEENKYVSVTQNTRLNNRVLDLRVPANQAIMRIKSKFSNYFRDFLNDRSFVEINTPKIVGGTTEGGAEAFKVNYYGKDACLAQSPQFYKQMALLGDFDKVYEFGPAYRAEESHTSKHLCEFTSFDIEMKLKYHYFEVIDFLEKMLLDVFARIDKTCGEQLETVNEQYPFEKPLIPNSIPKLSFEEAVELLRQSGVEQSIHEDLSANTEKALAKIVRDKYQSDLVAIYNYPKEARPFYTMPNPSDPSMTNSYDFLFRGEEILSGAQRINNRDQLLQSARDHGIEIDENVELYSDGEEDGDEGVQHKNLNIANYANSFKYGAPMHAGAGLGFERIVKLYLGLDNIRKVSMFPRDPKRLHP